MFPCTSCGCCCKRIDKLVKMIDSVEQYKFLKFPYKYDENGKCEKLTDDNKCSVYDNRPLVCNIKKTSESLNIDTKEFYKNVIGWCNQIMDEDKMPLEFRIKN